MFSTGQTNTRSIISVLTVANSYGVMEEINIANNSFGKSILIRECTRRFSRQIPVFNTT